MRPILPDQPTLVRYSLGDGETALYGPARRVVWEGGAARLLPIPIYSCRLDLHEHNWRNIKAFAQHFYLTNVELTFAG